MAVPSHKGIALSDVCKELYGSYNTYNRTLIDCHNDADPNLFDASYNTSGKSLMDFRNYGAGALSWRPIDGYCEQGEDQEETHGWRLFGNIRSNSSNYGFARFRLVGADSRTKVRITKEVMNSQGNIEYIDVEKPFHSGGGWTNNPEEHDFTFDLSDAYIEHEEGDFPPSFSMAIFKHKDAYVSEIVASPPSTSGFSGLRNADAQIVSYWYYSLPVKNTLVLENQPLDKLVFSENNNGIVFPKNLSIKDTGPAWDDGFMWIDAMIFKAVESGKNYGSLDIRNSEGRTSKSDSDWATLQSRGWTLYE